MERSDNVLMQSRRRAPDRSNKGCVAFAKWERFLIQGLMYCKQLMRWETEPLSMLVMAAETSWIKSNVNCGANSASFSLKFSTKAIGYPEIKPATNTVREVAMGQK